MSEKEKDKAGKVTGYKQTGNGYKTQFPAELSEDSGISLTAGDRSITMTPLHAGRNKAGAAQATTGRVKDYTGKVTYRDVFGEGADIELCTTLTGIKEDIVLKKAPAGNVFEFLITAPGLDPVVTDSGAVEFYDPETLALKFRIPEAYAKDSYNGAMLEGGGHYTEDIRVSVTAAGNPDDRQGKWIYRLEVDEEFLFGENMVYPVRIDPTLSVTSVSYHKDAYINSANPDTNYYLNTFMCVGRDSTLLKCRTYVKVMLNQLYATDALAVSKAEYYITETAGYTSDCNIRLYRIETSWSSNTIIWNNRPGIDSTVIDNQFVNGAGTYKYNITTLVNGWYLDSEGAEGGFANNGFLLMSDREDSLVYRRFASSDASVDPPYLVITYTNVDRTAPNPPTNLTTSYIKEPTSNGTAQLKLNWTAAADLPNPGASGIKNYELVIKNSSGTTVYTNNNVSATATSYTTTGYYPDIETYTFYLKAVDKAKEVDGTAIYNKSANATATRYVPDCKKPVIDSSTLIPASSVSSPTNTTSLTLNWTITDDSSLSKLEYWVNTYAVTTVTNLAKTGSLTASTAPLGTGSYTLYVKATDTCSNVSTTTSIGFTIDRMQPAATSAFTSELVGSTFILPMSFSDNYVLSQAIAEYGAGTSPASYTQLAAETLTGTSDTWSPQISTAGWTAAQYYTIRVRVKDKAGNWNNTFTRTVIKNGASITIPAALVMDPLPTTITTPSVQINHNRRTTKYSDVFINSVQRGAFSPNAAISIAVNRPEYPEGSAIDLIVRAYDPATGPAEYNAELQRSTYIHDMSTTSGLTLTNTVIDTAAGVLKLASGYTTGSAILSVPFPEAGARIDSVCTDALAQIPSGSSVSCKVYDPLTQTWRSLSIGTWLYFCNLSNLMGSQLS